MEAVDSDDPISLSRGRCSGYEYPLKQQWKVVKREQLQKLGPSNYIIYNEVTNRVLAARTGTVFAEPLSEKLDPTQIWHAYYPEDAQDKGFRLLSYATGEIMEVTKEHGEPRISLIAPEDADGGSDWYLAERC